MHGEGVPPDPMFCCEGCSTRSKRLSSSRGKLKIFLGAAAGVGKTYQMLEEAQSPEKGLRRCSHRPRRDPRTARRLRLCWKDWR